MRDERISGTVEARVLSLLASRGLRLATAESCTGGGIGARITAVPGASEHYVGGVVSYANEVKTGVLGVDPAVLEKHGAVSEPVVRQMARGAARLCGAECAVSVSGVAGPGGGTPEKPVGTVWMAALVPEGCSAEVRLFPGDREAVRNAAQIAVLELLERALEGKIELSTGKSEKDLHI